MKNKYGKFALFMAIITFLFLVTTLITQIDIFSFITYVAFILTLAAGVVWLSSLIFRKIKYSKNLIVSLVLLVLTLVIWPYALNDGTPYTSVILALLIFAFVVSIIVYIGRLIFGGNDKKDDKNDDGVNAVIHDSSTVAVHATETKEREDEQK